MRRRLGDRLQAEAFAALGAASSNHRAATTRLHAHQETMRTSATDFRGLVGAFHVGSCVSSAPRHASSGLPASGSMVLFEAPVCAPSVALPRWHNDTFPLTAWRPGKLSITSKKLFQVKHLHRKSLLWCALDA